MGHGAANEPSKSAHKKRVERETGFEPATCCLEGSHSTAELLPHCIGRSSSEGSKPMTIRAHDIARRHLVQYPRRTGAPDHPRHGGSLRARVAVVEIHRTWWKPQSAVHAGSRGCVPTSGLAVANVRASGRCSASYRWWASHLRVGVATSGSDGNWRRRRRTSRPHRAAPPSVEASTPQRSGGTA